VHSENLKLLVASAELAEVVAFELSAKRAELLSNDPVEVPQQIEVQPSYNLTTMVKSDGMGFLIRLAVEVSLPTGQIRCEVGAAYTLKEKLGFDLSPNDLIEYSNEVAVMTLLPFVRQHIADLSQRALGFPLIMPIMQRGALNFSLN
jgi:hypothetical protein